MVQDFIHQYSKSAKRQFVCQQLFLSIQRAIGKHLEASEVGNLPHLPMLFGRTIFRFAHFAPRSSTSSKSLTKSSEPALKQIFYLKNCFRAGCTCVNYSRLCIGGAQKCSTLDSYDRLMSMNTRVLNIE